MVLTLGGQALGWGPIDSSSISRAGRLGGFVTRQRRPDFFATQFAADLPRPRPLGALIVVFVGLSASF